MNHEPVEVITETDSDPAPFDIGNFEIVSDIGEVRKIILGFSMLRQTPFLPLF